MMRKNDITLYKKMDFPKRIDSSRLPEEQLIERLKNGDANSFEFIVRHYGSYILAITKRYLASEADAHDALQETYLQAFRAIGNFQGRSSLKSWLHRIAINTSLMKLRSQKRRLVDLLDDTASLFDSNGKRIETESEATPSVEEVEIDNSKREFVRQQIHSLPETAKNLLLLRDIEGYSTSEVADLLGISIASVKTGLHRARHALKKKLINEQC